MIIVIRINNITMRTDCYVQEPVQEHCCATQMDEVRHGNIIRSNLIPNHILLLGNCFLCVDFGMVHRYIAQGAISPPSQ